jgi:hypothetical protein
MFLRACHQLLLEMAPHVPAPEEVELCWPLWSSRVEDLHVNSQHHALVKTLSCLCAQCSKIAQQCPSCKVEEKCRQKQRVSPFEPINHTVAETEQHAGEGWHGVPKAPTYRDGRGCPRPCKYVWRGIGSKGCWYSLRINGWRFSVACIALGSLANSADVAIASTIGDWIARDFVSGWCWFRVNWPQGFSGN